jgi:DNA-nicking Smr family endonuclease
MQSASGENLSYRSSSVGRRSFRKLTRGGFSVRSQIDLHGLTAVEAKAALAEFIDGSVNRGHLCVRVIHGKGLGSGERGPVLKRKVDTWLRQWKTVLAFVSARQVDGGTGAVYVLLRKS